MTQFTNFLVRLLETNAHTPSNLHFVAVINLILLQLQPTVDPEHLGVQLIIAHCSPPTSADSPVRSLREVMKMTTYQSLLTSPGDSIFLGAESLSGYSVSRCQASIVQNTDEEQRIPVRRSKDERSAAAYPLQRGGSVAGCFLVSSPQPDYFSQRLQYLLQIYAYLLSMAFEMETFYAPERIRLRPMPEESIQHDRIAGLQQRVITLLQGDLALTRLEAERAVWQEIEEELLVLMLTLNQQRRP